MTRRIEWVSIGVVVGAHGVKGELRVKPLTDFPERFESTKTVSALKDDVRLSFVIESARPHGNALYLLKLVGVDDRGAAEAMRRIELQVARDEAMPLPEGSYYIFDLIGIAVRTVEGESLGELRDVLQTGANDVYVVRDPRGKELLIPALKDVVKRVDLDERLMIVEPLPGLL